MQLYDRNNRISLRRFSWSPTFRRSLSRFVVSARSTALPPKGGTPYRALPPKGGTPYRGGTPCRGLAGFTMVEIALSLAVVAFALVAILGVLPTGMTVQKDNRDDGVINQEGRYWLEAIRSGARGLDDITNYVESITITNQTTHKAVTFDNGIAGAVGLRPQDVIALLSTAKYVLKGANFETNRVTARVKAITGPAVEKGPLTNEFSFRYEMQVEITGNNVSLIGGTFQDIEAQRRYVNTLGN